MPAVSQGESLRRVSKQNIWEGMLAKRGDSGSQYKDVGEGMGTSVRISQTRRLEIACNIPGRGRMLQKEPGGPSVRGAPGPDGWQSLTTPLTALGLCYLTCSGLGIFWL